MYLDARELSGFLSNHPTVDYIDAVDAGVFA